MIDAILLGVVSDPSGALTLATLGVIGTAIVGVWQRVLAINGKAEADRIARGSEQCEARYQELDRRFWVQNQQLRESEKQVAERDREIDRWRTLCVSLGWTEESPPKSSPNRTGPA